MTRYSTGLASAYRWCKRARMSSGRVGVSLALIARDENAARYHAGDTSHTDPLPDASHDQILPKLRW